MQDLEEIQDKNNESLPVVSLPNKMRGYHGITHLMLAALDTFECNVSGSDRALTSLARMTDKVVNKQICAKDCLCDTIALTNALVDFFCALAPLYRALPAREKAGLGFQPQTSEERKEEYLPTPAQMKPIVCLVRQFFTQWQSATILRALSDLLQWHCNDDFDLLEDTLRIKGALSDMVLYHSELAVLLVTLESLNFQMRLSRYIKKSRKAVTHGA